MSKNILEGLTDIDDLIKNLHKIGYLPEGIFAAKEVFLLFRSLGNNSNYSNLANIVYKILNKELMPEAVIDYMRNFKV